jgi:hypothetical protein
MQTNLTWQQRVRLMFIRRKAYKECFMENGMLTGFGKDVLADLKRFCRGDGTSTFIKNDLNGRQQALLEGRREVYERIKMYLNADEEELEKLKEVIGSED